MPNIHHEVIIGAAAEDVYNAITGQDGLCAWWTPDTIAKAEVDTIARFGFGPTYVKEMKIAELKPFERVRWICLSAADEWVGTTLTFNLEVGDKKTLLKSRYELGDQIQQQNANDNLTLLIFQHNGWKEYSPMYAECNYTWGRFLRSLKLFCETGNGTPWPDQHRVH